MLKPYATDPNHAAHLNHAAAPAPAPSLLARLLAWWRRLFASPTYRMAPPLANPHYLHHSTKRNAAEVWPINWSAMRGRNAR